MMRTTLSDASKSVTRIQITGRSSHSCGYCSKDNKHQENETSSNTLMEKCEETQHVQQCPCNSISYGCISDTISVRDYESMMLIGWRRSGKYFYKPCLYETCCPQYTIRLNVKAFKASKSQKKVLKNIEKYTTNTSDARKDLSIINNNMTENSVPLEITAGVTKSLDIQIEKSSFTNEKFELYKRYQIDVHKDDPITVTAKGFKRFLVDSPLIDDTQSIIIEAKLQQEHASVQYGTFHQLYRLNGELIAVGVLDILPTGVSSVYVFYDNNYRHLVLGKYTALQEINFCLTNDLPYYYMGFYIHTCEKMRYKGEYIPSELLCPTSLTWFPLSECVSLLNTYKFSPFEPQLALRRQSHHIASTIASADESNSIREDLSEFAPQFTNQMKDITLIPLDLGAPKLLSISDLTSQGVDILTPILTEWLDNVGPEIGKRLVITLK